ncbi:MAG: thiamine phosphate synthase [Muribaculaceae bacterium]|nr:thiamine phosphate synthase [Muribaculaceae bacterium]
MLQILIKPNDKYSLAEMAQMAVEGGAGWIVVDGVDENDSALRDTMPEVVDMCREAGVFLTITDRPGLARDLGLHGVFLTDKSLSPVSLREELGAEAVIGAIVSTPDAAASLERADVDYVALGHDRTDAKEFIDSLRAAGAKIPVVAYRPGEALTPDTVTSLLATGYSGICGGDKIFESANPVAAVEQLLNATASR